MALQCSKVFMEKELTLENLILAKKPPRAEPEAGGASMTPERFQNGAFLRMFFGPEINRLHQWLDWLKNEDTRAFTEIDGLCAYCSRTGIALARTLEFPFDFGMDLRRADRRNVLKIMDIPVEDLSLLVGKSDIAQRGRQALLDQLDIHLFGVYAAKRISQQSEQSTMLQEALDILSLSHSPGLTAAANPKVPYRMRSQMARPVESTITAHDQSPVKQLYEVVEVVAKTEDTIVIKVPLGKDHRPKNKMQEIIQQMFFITYWQMIQKSYRESGLFENTIESALYLMDNFVKTMRESSDQQSLYMMYDRMAWEVIEFRMALAHKYVAIEMFGVDWQPYRYQTIADVFSPLFPVFGMTVEKYPTGEYEVKRLFQNTDPDPLQIQPPSQLPKGLNMLFYHQVAKDLPEGGELVAISKTKVHTRLYKSLGFELTTETFNPDWNGPMYILNQPLQRFIDTTAAKAPVIVDFPHSIHEKSTHKE